METWGPYIAWFNCFSLFSDHFRRQLPAIITLFSNWAFCQRSSKVAGHRFTTGVNPRKPILKGRVGAADNNV